MLSALSIYGADRSVEYSDSAVAMGHCMLRLLPEDRFDRQPLCGEGVSALVADLRLDNREEIARDLKIPLDDAAGLADSDLLLAAWQRWREGCLDRFSGAYSFAVWNAGEQELFLARDHTGERPLYYFSSKDCFAFASMPKGLHPLPFVQAEIDEDYVVRYLTAVLTPMEQTIFRRITRLPPGSAMSVRPGKIRLWRYWKTDQLEPLPPRSDEEYLEQFREIFDEAVRSRLRTTGGIGSDLSGGLDSSSVATTAAHLLARQGRGLTAFTAVPRAEFDGVVDRDHFGNEGPAAAEVAAIYPNMRHVLVDASHLSFLDVVDHNNWLYDLPAGGPTNEVWFNAIMQQAQAAGVTVLLNGSNGNVTFSDYGLTGLSGLFRSGRWFTLAKLAVQLKMQRSASLRSVLRNSVWPSLPFWLRRLTDPHMRSFSLEYSPLRPEIIQRLGLDRQALRDAYSLSPQGRSLLHFRLQHVDYSETTTAPQAAWKLDYRDPTFDRRVVEFCLRVPLEQFLAEGKLRSLARRSMDGRLPPSTLNRRERGRQSSDWFLTYTAERNRMLSEIGSLERSPLASRFLDLGSMRQLLLNWPSSAANVAAMNSSHFMRLGLGFSVGSFLRRYDPDFRRPV